jgi:hypothetical protein
LSKTELHFKLNAAIAVRLNAATAKTETSAQRNRLGKKLRAEISHRRHAIGAVKKISYLDGKLQPETAFVIITATAPLCATAKWTIDAAATTTAPAALPLR